MQRRIVSLIWRKCASVPLVVIVLLSLVLSACGGSSQGSQPIVTLNFVSWKSGGDQPGLFQSPEKKTKEANSC
jgi:hypothetical protein